MQTFRWRHSDDVREPLTIVANDADNTDDLRPVTLIASAIQLRPAVSEPVWLTSSDGQRTDDRCQREGLLAATAAEVNERQKYGSLQDNKTDSEEKLCRLVPVYK